MNRNIKGRGEGLYLQNNWQAKIFPTAFIVYALTYLYETFVEQNKELKNLKKASEAISV